MVVTSVEPLNKNKCKVFLDEDFAFVLYKKELSKYKIVEQKVLEQSYYQEIISKVLYKRARERIIFLLESSDKTEFELRKKLAEGFYPQDVIDQAIEFVLKNHYIDDVLYAERYVERNKNKKSKTKITYELKGKGIEAEYIQAALEGFVVAEEEQIYKILQRKKYCRDSLEKKQQDKITMSLVRKGYSYQKIKKVMDNFEEIDV